MHQKNNGNTIAYYVSNFTRDVDAIDDVDGTPSANAIATVAMEYSPIQTGGIPVTKFYVFNAAGDLITSADLDGNGPKFIPGLCITCHGGEELNYTAITNLQNEYTATPDAVPKFIPFDLKSFIYSNKAGSDRLTQEPFFRNMNEQVLNTNKTQATTDWIFKSYNSTALPLSSVNFDDNAVVSGWNSTTPTVGGVIPSDFYKFVVGPSCRTCHINRSDDGLWFDTDVKFTSNVFRSAVCGANKFMPNAKVTFINFWISQNPHRPNEVRKILGANSCN